MANYLHKLSYAYDMLLCRKLKDHNEVTHHFLCYINDHLSLDMNSRVFKKAHMPINYLDIEFDKEAILSTLASDDFRSVFNLFKLQCAAGEV